MTALGNTLYFLAMPILALFLRRTFPPFLYPISRLLSQTFSPGSKNKQTGWASRSTEYGARNYAIKASS